MGKWHKLLVGNSSLLISAILIIALLAISGRSGSIQTLGGLAVAGPGSSWINLQDVSVGTPIASGAAAVGPYWYNGTNYDSAKGDATNGLYVNVKATVAPVGAKTPADGYAIPTDGLDQLSFMMGFNGTNYDRMRSIANNADAVAVTTLGIYPTGSYLYVFNGTSWDRSRSATIGNGVAATGLPVNAGYVEYVSPPSTGTTGQYGAMLSDNRFRPMMGLTGAYSYSNITTNVTATVLSGAGYLHTITVNTKGASANIATVYDNTAGSGTKIGTIDTTSNVGTLTYDAVITTGITIVTATGTAGDLTIAYKAN